MKSARLFIYLIINTIFGVNIAASQSNDDMPNIIFILTDDESMGYLGVTGNDVINTPNIDKLAEEGTFFTNAYITSAICTPSRASIFLSQYERTHGINFNSGTSMSPEALANTYPMQQRAAGYYTGYIGKNHVPIGEYGYETGLIDQSFDYWYAAHRHLEFYPKDRHDIFQGAENDTQVEIMEEGVEDFLNDNEYSLAHAIHFMDKRPQDQPFSLSISFNLPHSTGVRTMEQRPEDPDIYKTLYRDQEIPLPEHYVAKADITEPKLPPSIHRVEDRQWSYDFVDTPATVKERHLKKMQAMTGIDLMVGRLREKLDELGVAENTIIIYTSDHGLFMGQFGLGGKGLCYEQVTQVPLIIYNPLVAPENRVSTSDALVQSIDIAPTMLAAAGILAPDNYQGIDISGILDGSTESVRDFIYTENLWSNPFGNPRCEAVQCKEWKYIRYYENNNLSAQRIREEARAMGINVAIGSVTENSQTYRSYVYGPLEGEPAVYEELYKFNPDAMRNYEVENLVNQSGYQDKLDEMREVWDTMIHEARGTEAPLVLPIGPQGVAH